MEELYEICHYFGLQTFVELLVEIYSIGAYKWQKQSRLQIIQNQFLPKLIGNFGTDCEKEWPMTVAMKLKGGMDEIENSGHIF